jgi:hypothetical protein
MGSIQDSDVRIRARLGVRCRLGIFCRFLSTESQVLQTSAEQRTDVFDLFNNIQQIEMPLRPQRHRRPRLDHHARGVVDGRDVNRMDSDTALRALRCSTRQANLRRSGSRMASAANHPELTAELAHRDLKIWIESANNGQSSK